ncbi:hypothetical protein [Aquabacterium sp.]|uniref:hypothetical protein n=1 Tax=Aquabacterium sp. TaxID=1872578 RepID=UPI0025C47D6E|nr:hypothetical protein [Aquabacterium sp.]
MEIKKQASGSAATETSTSTATSAPAAQRQPLPEPAGGWPRDEYTGIGGNYVRDPFTGIRRPADDTATAPAADTPAEGQ